MFDRLHTYTSVNIDFIDVKITRKFPSINHKSSLNLNSKSSMAMKDQYGNGFIVRQ